MSNNPRPHVYIPRPAFDTQQPAVPVSPLSSGSRSPRLSPLRRQPSPLPPGPHAQSAPDLYSPTTPMSFPEPQFYRSTSFRETLSPPSNRSNRSLNNNTYNTRASYTSPSVSSFGSSYVEDDHYDLGSFEVCSPIPSLLSSNSSVERRRHARFNTQTVFIIFVCSSAIVSSFSLQVS